MAFTIVAVASFTVALLLAEIMPDTRLPMRKIDVYAEFNTFRAYCRIKSFAIVVLQGCLAHVPWSAMTFMTMFLQYSGQSDTHAGLLQGLKMLSVGFGALIGGYLGDWLTVHSSRFHGRPLTAQISFSCAIPVVWMLLFVVPAQESTFALNMLFLMALGLLATWSETGTSRPILTEVVTGSHQARVMSWNMAIAGSFSSCMGSPAVAFLAEHFFQYQPQNRPMASIPLEVRRKNADALAKGMFWMAIVPWTLCLVTATCLHWTYERDVHRLSGKTLSEDTPLKNGFA